MKKISFPSHRQMYNYDCGPTALQSVFVYYGIEVRADLLMKIVGTEKKHGTDPRGLIKAIKKFNLKCFYGSMDLEILEKFIDKKIPVILAIQAWSKEKKPKWKNKWKDGHYVVAIGYDKKNIYFEDPSSHFVAFIPRKELLLRWHDIDKHGNKYFYFGIAIYGRRPIFDERKIVRMK